MKISVRRRLSSRIVASLFGVVMISAAQQSVAEDRIGSVHFPTSCSPGVATKIERGVALLHHMMYGAARQEFRAIEAEAPDCAIALWGIAMTYIHPLWPDRPTPEDLALGEALSLRASSLANYDERDAGYLATTAAYFENGENASEAERLVRFESAWKAAYEADPKDLEAKSFYALSQLATVDTGDKTYAKRLRAGALVEAVLAAVPDHPGAHHYIIHSYDAPELADRSLEIARHYGVIGPQVSHALHMMTHIFTRLGFWDESIEWNVRSAEAALSLPPENAAKHLHYLHALDYLAYAYLQTGDDSKALEVTETMAALAGPFSQVNRVAQAYALGATPARYALERKAWGEAATLAPRIPASFPWEPTHSQYIAHTHFAKGLGLAHLGRFDEASNEIKTLEGVRDKLESTSPYWATQVDIQRMDVAAWVSFLSGDKEKGISMMKEAAALEATTEKNPVTPGAILPASELLGDMLTAMGRYDEAIAAYETTLDRSPLRLNSLFALARAYKQIGNEDAAQGYLEQIAAMTDPASTRVLKELASR